MHADVPGRAGHQGHGPDAAAASPRWTSTSRSTSRRSTSTPRSRRCRSRIRPYYATYLAKRIGPFATLGLAEDTWALNEGVIDDGTFLQQTYDIDASASAMFFAALDRLRRGTPGVRVRRHRPHPAHVLALPRRRPSGRARARAGAEHRDAIATLYRHNDALVGAVLEQLGDGRRADGDLRSRLQLVPPRRQPQQLAAARRATWRSSPAPTAAPSGCATSTGRRRAPTPRAHRHVPQPEGPRGARASSSRAPRRRRSRPRSSRKLDGPARRREGRRSAINEAFDTAALYAGPYLENAPDLIIGYNAGYRTSWDCATGVVAGPGVRGQRQGRGAATTASTRGWCRACSSATGAIDRPTIRRSIDIAPTALRLFGIEPPAHMDGRPLDGRHDARAAVRVVLDAPALRGAVARRVALRPRHGARRTAGKRHRPRLRRPGLRADARLMARGPAAELRAARRAAAASRRSARRSRRRARSPGRRSSPASIRAATASSTSSTATRRR